MRVLTYSEGAKLFFKKGLTITNIMDYSCFILTDKSPQRKTKTTNEINDMKLTQKEKVMLQMMAQNCFSGSNYDEPEEFEDCGTLWSNQLDNCTLKEGMELPPERSFGGIMASLVKKGLAVSDDWDGRDSTCALTEEGFQAWQEQVQKVDFTKEGPTT